MAILSTVSDSMVLLGCMLVIIDFDVLCVLDVDVPLMKNHLVHLH